MSPAVLLLIALSAPGGNFLAVGDHSRELKIGETFRSYSVHIPPSYDPARPTPVVLVFHSAMMNGNLMARFCGLSEKADRCGFVVVYANGTGSTPLFLYWDAGGVRGRVSDDVGYVARLLDDLATVVNVDPKRVFAAGMSNGAMMCYRLAAELSDRIAAIAAIAGTMAIEDCRPRRPVPVIHFHGTKDGLVLYGGPGRADPQEPEIPLGRRHDPGLGEARRLPGDSHARSLAGPRREGRPCGRSRTGRARTVPRWSSTRSKAAATPGRARSPGRTSSARAPRTSRPTT